MTFESGKRRVGVCVGCGDSTVAVCGTAVCGTAVVVTVAVAVTVGVGGELTVNKFGTCTDTGTGTLPRVCPNCDMKGAAGGCT